MSSTKTKKSKVHLMGRPALPMSEKRHRITVTVDYECLRRLKRLGNRSAFVEAAIKEKFVNDENKPKDREKLYYDPNVDLESE